MWVSDNLMTPDVKDHSPNRSIIGYSLTKEFIYPEVFRTHKDYPKKHKPDITVFKLDPNDVQTAIAFIEIDGKIGIEYTGLDGKKHKSTPTKHDKPNQKKNDHIFEEYVKLYHHCPVIRLLKEEILTDDKKDREYYLKKNLKGIKK